MPGLTALALPAGPRFVERIVETWERGNAFAPIDPRLPAERRKELLAVIKPTEIIYWDGITEGREAVVKLNDGEPVAEGDALVMATSGTGGQPKAVIHTHQSITASAQATSKALTVDPLADKWLACLPVAHIGGLSVILRSLVTGTPVEVHNGFDADSVRLAAQHRGVTLVSLVTRALTQIPADLFRTILIGGAAPPDDLPANVIPTYGMTETGSGVVYGNRMLDGCEIQILDANREPISATSATGANSATGRIVLRGPMLFRGYRNQPSPFFNQGWFDAGDLGHWSDDGVLVVEGRDDDVIITGGEKVWPAPIEHLLASHPDVHEIALIGRPDPQWGSRVVAVVVPSDPSRVPSVADLKDTIEGHFPLWSAPKDVEVRTKPLPRTSLGKIRRRLLADGRD